ncbi:MCE family protein [Mycolicibacterium sp. XJ1819]
MNVCIKVSATLLALAATTLSACDWRGVNSLPLPGTVGSGPGSISVQAQLPDVDHIERNSRVRVGDVTVGNVTRIERQGWHALVSMRIDGDVDLPANATAKVGQTSLLGSLHIELAAPVDEMPQGRLHDGSLIPLASGGAYPSTERTLAALSLILNGGGIGHLQEITQSLSTAFDGRADDLRNLIQQIDTFIGNADDQTDDIIAATTSLNNLVQQFADQKPVLDKAIQTIPDALVVLKNQRENMANALVALGRFSALTADSTNQVKDALVQELKDVGSVLQSLADAGPAMTRALSFFGMFPWPNETFENWVRGDYANLTAIIDLTLSRLDSSLFVGTRWEGDLTELEMQWGRTIGQMPSPYTARNPLVLPYHFNQGP